TSPLAAGEDAPVAFTNKPTGNVGEPTVIIEEPQMAAPAQVTQGAAPVVSASADGPILAMRPINPGESYTGYGEFAHQVGLENYLNQGDTDASDILLYVATVL